MFVISLIRHEVVGNEESYWRHRFLVAAMLFAVAVFAQPQQPGIIPRIGILIAGSATGYLPRVEALRQRLRELGYIEEKTLSLNAGMQMGNSNGSSVVYSLVAR